MRIAALLEYDGRAFCGWQRQADEPSAQEAVEFAFSAVADQELTVTAAGRTDAGVHATAQVLHFDTSAQRSGHSWLRGANSHLPPEVAVLWTGEVADDFHARHSALTRRYHYVILNRAVRPALLEGRVTHEYRPLDEALMRTAATCLVGTHDFSAFRAQECQAKTPVRKLRRLEVERRGEFVVLTAEANAFLHHMVRNIAGVLMAIGAGEHGPDWAREVLEGRDRTLGGVTAPPDGLYLTGVSYPEHYGLPALTLSGPFW